MVTARDERYLAGVEPALVAAYRVAAAKAERDNTPIFVVYGGRSAQVQRRLFEQGRTSPGKIVTHADGYTVISDHQMQPDGFYHAIDFAFYPSKTRPDAFDTAWPWATVASYACACDAAIRWGGTFKTPADLDHLQFVKGA